jgi:hypothetical protein
MLAETSRIVPDIIMHLSVYIGNTMCYITYMNERTIIFVVFEFDKEYSAFVTISPVILYE